MFYPSIATPPRSSSSKLLSSLRRLSSRRLQHDLPHSRRPHPGAVNFGSGTSHKKDSPKQYLTLSEYAARFANVEVELDPLLLQRDERRSRRHSPLRYQVPVSSDLPISSFLTKLELPESSDRIPWMSDNSYCTYIGPLCAHGWKLRYSDERFSRKTAFLTREFKLSSISNCVKFMNGCTEIIKNEDHPPASITLSYTKPIISVQLQTKSSKTKPYRWYKRPHGAGITDRDLRLAMLFEELFQEKYAVHEYEAGREIMPIPTLQYFKDILSGRLHGPPKK